MGDSPQEIAKNIRAVGHIEAVPTLLQVLCETTGIGFSAVALVTDQTLRRSASAYWADRKTAGRS
jgi:hypothetical protein